VDAGPVAMHILVAIFAANPHKYVAGEQLANIVDKQAAY
jgi:hypothetical protein